MASGGQGAGRTLLPNEPEDKRAGQPLLWEQRGKASSSSDITGDENNYTNAVAVDSASGSGSDLSREGTEVDPDVCVVQFSSPIFYGDMFDGEVVLDVLRIGGYDSLARVAFHTKDASARAGQEYVGTTGTVMFAVNEFKKEIRIPFIRDQHWSATVEFKVVLSHPVCCKLGSYHKSCRVKVIDDNYFPSDAFREVVKTKDIAKVPGLSLWWSYCKWNASRTRVGWLTLLTLLMDQLQNFHYLVMISCDMYLVNVICNPNSDESLVLFGGDRLKCAYLIGALHFFPHLLLLIWEFIKRYLDLQGRAMLHLRKQMYRKYMNFSTTEVNAMGPEILEFGLFTEVPRVVRGYSAGMDLVRVQVNVLLNVAFVAYKRPQALPFIGMVMGCMLLWGLFKRNDYLRVPGAKKEVTQLSRYVKETAEKHDLISIFFIRPQMNAGFEEAAEALQLTGKRKEVHHLNTHAVLSCISPLFVGIYICRTVGTVIDDQSFLGTWLAMIRIITNVANQLEAAYEAVLDLGQTFEPLRNVTTFLNSETETRKLMEIARRRNSESLAALENEDGSVNDFDTLPVFCKNMCFSVNSNELLSDVSVAVVQGATVGVYGPNGSGKNSLLRLLAQQAVATSGEVFVPCHLRPLLVTRNVQFLDRSLISNLTIGHHHFHEDELPRLKQILYALDLSYLIQVIQAEIASEELRKGPNTWSQSLSNADKHKIGFARALFLNPEVLVLQKPFVHYDLSGAETVAGLISSHVKDRGVYMGGSEAWHRRPRTAFFTCDEAQDCQHADVVWAMEPTGQKTPQGSAIWTVAYRPEASARTASQRITPRRSKTAAAESHWLFNQG